MTENSNQSFVHLRVHSEYSLEDGLLRIGDLVESLSAQEMPAVAITDITNLFATVKFYKQTEAAGIKPIIGSDLLLDPDGSDTQPAGFTLLARNWQGYLNLIEIISLAYTQGQKLGSPLVRREWLERHNKGLIFLSGAQRGEIGRQLVGGHRHQASESLQYWMRLYPQACYLELQRTGRPDEENYIHAAVDLAAQLNCPVVATNDVRFLKREEFEAHEARVCITQGRVLNDTTRPRQYSAEQYLKSADEMTELFADIPEAIENSLEIAKRCSVTLDLGKVCLPEYPIPDGLTEEEYFRRESREGLEQRLQFVLSKEQQDYQEKHAEYLDRLNTELDIIIQMGFPGYFLIVMDFIRWAKQNGIPVGPGRGSGAGSVVAYALGITDLDPLAYDLLFERFLNPERVSMPDFDVDFCMERRDEVIAYVAERYGRDAVSQIVTFGTMAAKAVVRDVARVQGKSYGLADKLSKLIPFDVGMTLEKAVDQEEELRTFLKGDDDAQEIWEMALQLEGVARNCGKHAGGVVIAPTKLTDFAPLYCDDQGGSLVTQFDKDDVESAGLVKFDFLGLRTLTIIDWAVKNVNRTRAKSGEEPLVIDHLPLDDRASFELLQSGATTAVFQLESRGMKDLIRRIQPSTFEDIIALVALFRPGPLQSGMVDDFIDRKHGRAKVAYPHPDYQHEDLKPVLEPTYGIILYQEQVMQIAQILGGYTLGAADLLRRAMGKKKPEEMAKQREIFLKGATERGVELNLAGNIFDLMEKFAGYGFNKSHSAAYALVAYQTAWLKAHYPAEFMAAVMSADLQHTDKVVTFIDEARSMGLTLVPPRINQGYFGFTVNDSGEIVYGLGALKGLGEGPISSILEARNEAGEFRDLYDFCQRIDLRKVNKRAMEALIKAGALDELVATDCPSESRTLLMAALPGAIQSAEQVSKNTAQGIEDLFGGLQADEAKAGDPYAESRKHIGSPISLIERLKGEKDTLGLFLTGHPVDEFIDELVKITGKRLVEIEPGEKLQLMAGLIMGIRTVKTRNGSNLAIVTLDDSSARIDVTLYSDLYDSARDILVKDSIVIVEGVVSIDSFNNQNRTKAKNIYSLQEARNSRLRELSMLVESDQVESDWPEKLKHILGKYQGGKCPIRLRYRQNGHAMDFMLGNEWRVEARDELLDSLKSEFGTNVVSLRYH